MRMGIGLTGVMQATEEQLSWLDDAYMHLRDFDESYSKENGFNVSIKLTTIKPSGCSKKETLISTEAGLLYLYELGDTTGETWQELNLDVAQETSFENASKFFVNGLVDTIQLVTDGGVDIECTPSHQYRILTSNGDYVWKAAIDIEAGDKLPYALDTCIKKSYVTLEKTFDIGPRSAWLKQPTILDEKLAYLLGLYLADGSTHTKGIRIAGNTTTKAENLNYTVSLIKELFEFDASINVRKESINADIYFTSLTLLKWLRLNGLQKEKALNVTIPLQIRMSPRSVIEAYIKGFFSGDGYLNKDTMTFTTVSKTLSQELVILMRYVGIDAKVREMPPTASSFGTNMRYWISERKGRKADPKYITKELRNTWQQLDELGLGNFSVDTVISRKSSKTETFDIEVPANNCYIAGSYVSHNTLSLLPGVTPGIHPGYARHMIRRITIASDNPLIATCKSHGYPMEYKRNFDGSEDYDSMIVSFPFSYPDNTILAEQMTAMEQLKWVKKMQAEWSDNSVSCTVYYRKEELPEIREYLAKHYKNNHKTLSFLLHSEHGFKQAPYEAISEEAFNALSTVTTKITSVSSAEFEGGDECATGACPIR